MTSNTIYLVREEEQDISSLSNENVFVNARLRSKVAVVSLDSFSDASGTRTEKIVIPRAPIRRLQAAQPAIKGTTIGFESRLVDIFPELAEAEPEEIESALLRMRRKESIEP